MICLIQRTGRISTLPHSSVRAGSQDEECLIEQKPLLVYGFCTLEFISVKR